MTAYLCQIVVGENGFDLCVDGRERFKQKERSEEHLPRVMSANSQQTWCKARVGGDHTPVQMEEPVCT